MTMSKGISGPCDRNNLVFIFKEPAESGRKVTQPGNSEPLARFSRAVSGNRSSGGSVESVAGFFVGERCRTRKELLRASGTEPDTPPPPLLDCLVLAASAGTLLWLLGLMAVR